ncbi:hypothetical protein Tco_0816221 [Tanacetum coccineum]
MWLVHCSGTVTGATPGPPVNGGGQRRYFKGVETPFNRPPRNDVNVVRKEMYIFNSSGRNLGKVEILELDGKSLAQAHRYVLLNHSKIQPFREFLSCKRRMEMKKCYLLLLARILLLKNIKDSSLMVIDSLQGSVKSLFRDPLIQESWLEVDGGIISYGKLYELY